MNAKINEIKGLYYMNNKVVKSLSNYYSFKKITSIQIILEEIIMSYGRLFTKKAGLYTTTKIKNFLIKNNIEVVDVIACFEDDNISKPIVHYPHTRYEESITIIKEYMIDFCLNNLDLKNDYIIEKNSRILISDVINENRELLKISKKDKLDKLDKIYEDENLNKNLDKESIINKPKSYKKYKIENDNNRFYKGISTNSNYISENEKIL